MLKKNEGRGRKGRKSKEKWNCKEKGKTNTK
jgi:hypothetical protein